MELMKCKLCKENLVLELYPDYGSSGIWCKNCGLNFANPKNNFPMIQNEIIDLVEGWNLLWDLAQDDPALNRDEFSILFVNMGKCLSNFVNMYYPCEFNENMTIFDKDQSEIEIN
jgi:hypothetical protein